MERSRGLLNLLLSFCSLGLCVAEEVTNGTCVYSLLFVLLNQRIITAFRSSHAQSIGASFRFFTHPPLPFIFDFSLRLFRLLGEVGHNLSVGLCIGVSTVPLSLHAFSTTVAHGFGILQPSRFACSGVCSFHRSAFTLGLNSCVACALQCYILGSSHCFKCVALLACYAFR